MKSLLFALLLLPVLGFAQGNHPRFSCEATAGVNGEFSKFSKLNCNKLKSVEACRGDFRCTPLEIRVTQQCRTTNEIVDALTGETYQFLSDGTVTPVR